MLFFLPSSPSELIDTLKTKFGQRRKALSYAQPELSFRLGVSLGSLKRFESSRHISLESLLKLDFVLECLGDFDGVCKNKEVMPDSIEEIANE